MTVEMDKLNRVFVEWGELRINSTDPQFQQRLNEMVEKYGPPTKVGFLAHNEGWHPTFSDGFGG